MWGRLLLLCRGVVAVLGLRRLRQVRMGLGATALRIARLLKVVLVLTVGCPVGGQAGTPSRAVDEFVALVRAPIAPAVSMARPRLRRSQVAATPVEASRRSVRLAAKGASRVSNPEVQARNVLLKKMGDAPPQLLSGEAALAACRAKFGQILSAGKQAALRELFPSTVWVEEVAPPCVA